MRPVTLGAPRGQADFYTWALGAFRQIEQASNDTLTDDASSSGAALATCAGAAADQIAYFTDETHTAFTDLTSFARTLLADTTAAAMRTTLGVAPSGSYLVSSNNLSDVANAATSRTNLGLGTAATHAATDFLLAADNLSDVASASTARTNLGLGTAATGTLGTGASDVVQLDGSSKLPAVDGSQLTNLPNQSGRLVAGTPLVLNPYSGSATTTQAHGLGVAPVYVQWLWECLTNNLNYVAGDKIIGGYIAAGSSLLIDATNLVLITNNATVAFPNKTTYCNASITAADWKLTLTPYKLT